MRGAPGCCNTGTVLRLELKGTGAYYKGVERRGLNQEQM